MALTVNPSTFFCPYGHTNLILVQDQEAFVCPACAQTYSKPVVTSSNPRPWAKTHPALQDYKAAPYKTLSPKPEDTEGQEIVRKVLAEEHKRKVDEATRRLFADAELRRIEKQAAEYERTYYEKDFPPPKLVTLSLPAQTHVELVGGPLDGQKWLMADVPKGVQVPVAWPEGGYYEYTLDTVDNIVRLMYYGPEDID